MTLARGERVHFDFDTGDISRAEGQNETTAPLSTSFVGDILERAPSATNPPSAPTLKAGTTGFPAHKKRTPRISAFKQQRAAKSDVSSASQQNQASKLHGRGDIDQEERRRIDEENKQRIAEMSEQEIEKERNDLLSSLSPDLIQKLLNRSNIDEGSNERDLFPDAPPVPPTGGPEIRPESKASNAKKVSFEDPESLSTALGTQQEDQDSTVTVAENFSPASPAPVSEAVSDQYTSSIHFPKPHQPPDLDPDSPSFLGELHEKYFPDLPYDPSSLSWMTPIDPADTTSPYHPSQTAMNASELRFDFKGALLAPSRAREISVSKGLHHHADAPEAAGYTIPELARLARSAVPTQRCLAYQILGRVLYRLGIGEFGQEREKRDVDGPVQIAKNPDHEDEDEDDVVGDEDAGSAMATGLWSCVEEGRVVETLTEEAAKERGHLTARTYAQEALWNWRRGGGRKRKAV